MIFTDDRFSDTSIFERRKNEWNLQVLEEHIKNIFLNVNDLATWRFKKIEWMDEKNKRKEELKKSIFKTISVTIEELTKKGEVKKDHVYNIQIPELIKDQFFYMGGLLKVPIFQLYDKPIIHRETKRGKILKYKNNCMGAAMVFNDKKNSIGLNIYTKHSRFSKNIPLSLLICNLHSKSELIEFYTNELGLNYFFDDNLNIKEQATITLVNKDHAYLFNLFTQCIDLYNKNNSNQLLEILGEYRPSTNIIDNSKKANSILFSIRESVKIDFFTKKFMKYECPLLDMLYVLKHGEISDTDLKNKRIRFSEYILSDLLSTVYDMICTLNYSSKVRFKISQSIIMDTCNVSDIIHYNFVYNPLGEIASFLQCSVTGPGGFRKDNVPFHLRNLDNSHFGKVCPADTPDRDGCGVILNLVPGVKLDDDGNFVGESELVTSYCINYVPFVKNDDQTRLQMSSNQLKQSLLLTDAERPAIKTGVESTYLDKTTFKNVAPQSGKVVYITDKILLVQYKDSTFESFKLGYRELYLNTADELYTDLKLKQKFKKGDVLVKSKYIKDDDVTLGQNFLTAVTIWEGFNYEDAFVISESAANRLTSYHTLDLSFDIDPGQVLLSLNDDNYKPLPLVGEKLSRGDVYARVKNIIGEEGVESVNYDPVELFVTEDCEIVDIEIYSNIWNKQIPQFNNFIKTVLNNQNDDIVNIKNILSPFLDKNEINKFLMFNELSQYESEEKVGKYAEKNDKIGGISVKIKAVYKETAGIGDKLANRHASKGIIGKIIKDEECPVTEDGRRIDIIVNQLGIISRMNVGQLYELHLSEALYKLKEKLKYKYNNETKNYLNIEKTLKEFLLLTDTSEDKHITKHILNKFKQDYKIDKIQAIENIQLIQPPFKSMDIKSLKSAMDMVGAKDKLLLNDPTKTYKIKKEIAVGYVYFTKLVHRSSDKIMGRSIGPYNKNILQPLGGKKRGGAHKIGELEVWSLFSHGAKNLIKEMFTTYSDSPGKKNKLLATILNNPELAAFEESDEKPQSYRLFENYLKVLGFEIKN
jgi:DNA-directed RNA polymerase beta subunit